ncbi:MAG: hypothetical protein C0481_02750 [Phenylobacterium sp.]|nr:hypothetical protein [Phenylobacterium sp.]
MGRPRHSNKEVEEAIAYAEARGWRVIKGRGHCWGRLFCPKHDRDGCRISIWSTPRVGQDHANDILRVLDRCSHAHGDDDEKV